MNFRLDATDAKLNKDPRVREYLDKVQDIIKGELARLHIDHPEGGNPWVARPPQKNP